MSENITLKQWHYRNLGTKFRPHLSGYNAGHLADAWTYQQKQIDSLKQQNELLREGLEKYASCTCDAILEETLKKVDELNKE